MRATLNGGRFHRCGAAALRKAALFFVVGAGVARSIVGGGQCAELVSCASHSCRCSRTTIEHRNTFCEAVDSGSSTRKHTKRKRWPRFTPVPIAPSLSRRFLESSFESVGNELVVERPNTNEHSAHYSSSKEPKECLHVSGDVAQCPQSKRRLQSPRLAATSRSFPLGDS